jgi:hypothetical protein
MTNGCDTTRVAVPGPEAGAGQARGHKSSPQSMPERLGNLDQASDDNAEGRVTPTLPGSGSPTPKYRRTLFRC